MSAEPVGLDNPTRGALHETRDCAVRALANAAGICYADAHAALELAGRKRRDGTYWRQLLAALDILDIRYSEPFGSPRCTTSNRITNTRKLAEASPNDRWLVSVPKHFTALVRGKYSDHIAVAQRARQVTGAVRLRIE